MQSYMITALYLMVLSAKTVFDLPDCTSKQMLMVMIIIDDDDCRECFYAPAIFSLREWGAGHIESLLSVCTSIQSIPNVTKIVPFDIF